MKEFNNSSYKMNTIYKSKRQIWFLIGLVKTNNYTIYRWKRPLHLEENFIASIYNNNLVLQPEYSVASSISSSNEQVFWSDNEMDDWNNKYFMKK